MSLNISYVIEAVDDFSKTFNEFKNRTKELDEAASVLRGVGASVTAAGVGLAAGIGLAVKTGADFDAQMSRVKAISGATSEEFAVMRKQALDLGASTSKSASEVATGFQEMAAMGFQVNEVMAAMPGVIAASEASGADMAQVAAVMASTLNAFALEATEAGRVADVLAMAANISAADITDMQYALKFAAGPAHALGVSLEELSAAIGIMVDRGATGEQAGTTLRASLLRLVKPTDEAQAALGSLGVSVTDSSGKFKPLGTLIGELQTGLSGMTDAQKTATLATIFGTEAVTGMLNVISAGPAAFNEMTTALQNSAGESAKAAAIMKDNFAGTMEELGGAFESLAIGISDALTPAIRTLAEMVTGVVNWFNELSPTTQTVIAVITALTAVFALIAGPLLILIGLIPSIIAGFTVIATTVGITSGALLGIIGVVGIVIAVVTVLAALIIANWDTIKAYTLAAWDAVKSSLIAVWGAIKGAALAVWDFLRQYFGGVMDAIVDMYKTAWNVILTLVVAAWENIKTLFVAYVETVVAVITAFWDVIKTVFATAFLIIVALVTGRWDEIGGIFRAAVAKLGDIVSGLWERLKTIWSAAFGAIYENTKNAIVNVIGAIVDLKDRLFAKWGEIKEDAVEMGKNIIRGLIDGIKSMASAAISAAMNVVKGAIDAAKNFLGINSPSRVFMEIGGFTGEGFALGLEDTIGEVRKMTQSLAGAAVDSVSSASSSGPSIANNAGTVASTSAVPAINFYAQYVDPTAAERFAAEVSRIIGRQTGGKR